MEIRVDLDRMQRLSEVFRREKEELESIISDLEKQIFRVLANVYNDYSELDVRRAVHEAEKIMQEIITQKNKVCESLEGNERQIKSAMIQYQASEAAVMAALGTHPADWEAKRLIERLSSMQGYYGEMTKAMMGSGKDVSQAKVESEDYNLGEYVGAFQGLGETVSGITTGLGILAYNNLTPYEKLLKYASGAPTNFYVKNFGEVAEMLNMAKGASTLERSGLATIVASEGLKDAFKFGTKCGKANAVFATAGIVLDTYDDVSQLKKQGADNATIHAAVVTDVALGAGVTGLSVAACAYSGAFIGTMIPVPVVGTVVGAIVGASVGVLTSYFLDHRFAEQKLQARDWLADQERSCDNDDLVGPGLNK